MKLVVKNISELVTMSPLVQRRSFEKIEDEDLGRIQNAWIAFANGRVEDFGSGDVPKFFADYDVVDAENHLVTPGLVDCHTHPMFGGDRSEEFVKRLRGVTYTEIAEQGGGIKYTVAKTREASLEELATIAKQNLDKFLSNGVTSVECKSGYGLSVEEELKMLLAYKKLKGLSKQTIKVTCLALHALYDGKTKKDFVDEMTNVLLPIAARDKLCDFVDAFVEKGYFSVEDASPFFEKAKSLGLKLRVHADEFNDVNGGLAAAEWGAMSADHLECTNQSGVEAMKKAGVVAVILPGTSLYTGIDFAKARPFLDAGCPVALATDFNPGSSRVDNLPFVATMGALHCKLTLPEAFAAVSLAAAKSLGLENSKGSLARGFDADFVIHKHNSLEQWIADMGQTKPASVFISAKRVL